MQQEQMAAVLKTATLPWEAYLAISFLPFVAGLLMAVSITSYWKKINRADGNPPFPKGRQLTTSILCGAMCGAFCQWALQEVAQILAVVPPLTVKAIISASVFTGVFTPVAYDLIRAYAKRTGKPGLYAILTVEHKRGVDYTDQYMEGDITSMYNPKSEDITEDKYNA